MIRTIPDLQCQLTYLLYVENSPISRVGDGVPDGFLIHRQGYDGRRPDDDNTCLRHQRRQPRAYENGSRSLAPWARYRCSRRPRATQPSLTSPQAA